jgi:hypothetical protein
MGSRKIDLEKEIWISNRFIDFPDEISVTTVELHNNQIRTIPKVIGHLANLTGKTGG